MKLKILVILAVSLAHSGGSTAGIGSVVSHARKIGKSDFVNEAKWLPELGVDKRLNGDYLWVKVGMVL